MTFYNRNVKTHLIDPVNNSSNSRTEWRLPTDTVLLSNFRIANLGAVLGGNFDYNKLCGVNSLIQSIHLYDGNQLLDQILSFPQWAGFSVFNKSNSVNTDLSKVLTFGDNGYVYSGEDYPANDGSVGAGDIAKIKHHYVTKKGNTTQATTAKGWLSLKSILPVLDTSLYVPTTVYKNLRLVIEYNNNLVQTNTQATASTTIEPLLIVDEIVDPKKQAQITSEYKGVSFMAIEHDRLYIPAMVQATSAVQKISQSVGGFNNKTVNRLLIVKSSTNGTAIGNDTLKGLGSNAVYNEGIQVRVNGSNIFPRDGITRPNQRLSLLNDVWGNCNSFNGCNEIYLSNAVNCVGQVGIIGNLDYFGCHIMTSPVNDLQIDFTRENVATMSARYNQQLILNIYAEVQKQITVQNGSYVVKYV
jgi:hypothetical protein